MNILVDRLPTEIEVDGAMYSIKTDFRACLSTILAFEDPELSMVEKQVIMLSNVFYTIPENTQESLKAALRFLDGPTAPGEDEDDTPGPRVYSFSKDASLIFAAFQQTHGIDLQTADMHWWKFLSLFMDLGSDTTFCSLVGLRKRVKTGKATKDERELSREMGSMFVIDEIDDRTLEERLQEQEFLALVRGGVSGTD